MFVSALIFNIQPRWDEEAAYKATRTPSEDMNERERNMWREAAARWQQEIQRKGLGT